MSCSKNAGPEAFLGFIKEVTGQDITQGEWHQIRLLAASRQGSPLSRSQSSVAEIFESARVLVEAVYVDSGIAYAEYSEGEKFDDAADRLVIDASNSKNTAGTLAAVKLLTEEGVNQTLEKIRFAKGNGLVVNGGNNILEYQDEDWAGEVAWENVPVSDRASFAWAMNSHVLRFYSPAMSDESEDLGYSMIDSAAEASRVLRSLPLDSSIESVVESFEESHLSEYMYADGDDHPAVTLWEEWKANGSR